MYTVCLEVRPVRFPDEASDFDNKGICFETYGIYFQIHGLISRPRVCV